MTPSISDHNRIVISCGVTKKVRSLFKYFNAWARDRDFYKTIQIAWNVMVVGSPMLRVTNKLYSVKKAPIDWRKKFSSIDQRITFAREDLEKWQSQLQLNPEDTEIFTYEREVARTLQNCLHLEEKVCYTRKAEINTSILMILILGISTRLQSQTWKGQILTQFLMPRVNLMTIPKKLW